MPHLDPNATYKIRAVDGKVFPLRDWQWKKVQAWFKGKKFAYFKPKSNKSNPKKLYYIDNDGNELEIFAVAEEPKKKKKKKKKPSPKEESKAGEDIVESAEQLKTAPPAAFRMKDGDFKLRAYQELAVRKWQADEPGEGMLTIKEDKLYYIDSKGKRFQLIAKFPGLAKPKKSGKCKRLVVSIEEIANKGDIGVHKGDFAGEFTMDYSIPAHKAGDHYLTSSGQGMHASINDYIAKLGLKKFGKAFVATDHEHPAYLLTGGGHDFSAAPVMKDKFLWLEPRIAQRENLYWPAYSALKTSGMARLMTGYSLPLLENAPEVLGYITFFRVGEDAEGVEIVEHNSSLVPPKCAIHKSSEGPLCGRKGYTKVPASKYIDAVIASKAHLKSKELMPVLCVVIQNPYHK